MTILHYNYRLLTPDEYELARPLLGSALPRPDVSAIAAAFNSDNQLVAVIPLQLQWHVEPIIILDPDVDFRRLKSIIDTQLRSAGGGSYYAFVNDEDSVNLTLSAGMDVLPVMVLKGTV